MYHICMHIYVTHTCVCPYICEKYVYIDMYVCVCVCVCVYECMYACMYMHVCVCA